LKPTRVLASIICATALVFVASPASAAEETVGSCLVEKIDTDLGGVEAVHAALEAGTAAGATEAQKAAEEKISKEFESCVKAPSPIIPAKNEIIWGGLSFLVLLGAMIKWGFPLVRSTMEARSERIRNDLQAAQAARVEAQNTQQALDAELAASKANAAKLIEQARQEALVLSANMQVKAEADVAEMKQRAAADVESARQRALSDLQSDVAEIVVGAAGRVVEKNLDVNTHRQLIDDYIASVGRQ
jgi:F-type H+-transporting ATPase subunit b